MQIYCNCPLRCCIELAKSLQIIKIVQLHYISLIHSFRIFTKLEESNGALVYKCTKNHGDNRLHIYQSHYCSCNIEAFVPSFGQHVHLIGSYGAARPLFVVGCASRHSVSQWENRSQTTLSHRTVANEPEHDWPKPSGSQRQNRTTHS